MLYHPDPHLPELVKSQLRGTEEARFVAKVCVSMEGKVFKIDVLRSIVGADDAIVATIRQWRYRAQPIPVCFVAHWVFEIK